MSLLVFLNAEKRKSAVSPSIVHAPDNIGYNIPDQSIYTVNKTLLKGMIYRLLGYFDAEVSYGTVFLFIPVFAAFGVVCYFIQENEPKWSTILSLLIISLGIQYLTRYQRTLWILSGFIVCVALGFMSAKIETWRLSTPMLGADVTTNLTARIVSFEKSENGQYRVLLNVIETQRPQLKYGPEFVRLSARTLPENLKPGDGLKGFVRLRAASGPVRPGSYDFGFYNYFQAIGANGFFLGQPEKLKVTSTQNILTKISQNIALLRLNMTKKITNSIDGEAGSVAAALITGQRGGILETTNQALRISGLAHILSISGLHMAMVSGMVLIVIRKILSFFPVFSSRYSAKKIAACVALIAAAFYLLLSGADVAAQRSFIMVAVMLVAVLCDRSAITMRNLTISGLITIIVVPHEILGPSFQMSFSATAALVAAFGWWSEKKRQNKNTTVPQQTLINKSMKYMVIPVVSTGMASLVAGFASGIYAAYHFSNAAPLGIVSNAIAFPVMSIAVMPFALLAAIAMPFGLEWYPLQIMGLGVTLVEKIAYGIAALSPDLNPGAFPSSGLVFLTLAMVILLFCKTILRFSSLLFFIISVVLFVAHKPPLIIMSEDAKLVGVIDGNTMAYNQTKPAKFTANLWQRSYRISQILLPNQLVNENQQLEHLQFSCDKNLCLSSLKNHSKLAVVKSSHDMSKACAIAHIIVVADPLVQFACDDKNKTTILRQQLALYGSVMVMDNGKIIWSSGGAKRPWNEHRKYSRAARGLL